MAVLGLRCCARAFSSCGKRGPLFIAVRGPLTIVASPVAEHRLQTRRLSSCGSRAQLLRVMWDPPRPGLEPMSPALAGRFSTTAPPGKPLYKQFLNNNNVWVHIQTACGYRHSSQIIESWQQLFLVMRAQRAFSFHQQNKMNTDALCLLTWKISKLWGVKKDSLSIADSVEKEAGR